MLRASATLLLFASCVALGACGDDDAGGDGGTRDEDGGRGGVASPDIPWLADGVPPIAPPELGPCPDGWSDVAPAADGDPIACDPYDDGDPLDCPPGQAHFPSEPGCSPVGAPCPAGDFADGLPTDRRVIYVRPGSVGGDGTEASPYGSLSEFARGSLPMGTVLALSRGVHDGPVRLSRLHELRGACAEATQLQAAAPAEDEGIVTLSGVGGVVRDLTLSDSPRPGVHQSGRGVDLRLEGVIVSGATGLGLYVRSFAHLSADSVVVRDTRARTRDLTLGRALVVEGPASADLTRAVLTRNRELAVFAGTVDTVVTLSDVVIRDMLGRPGGLDGGRALGVEPGARVDVSRSVMMRNRDLNVLVNGDGFGAEVQMTDVVIRDTDSQESDGTNGRAINIQNGGTLHLSRVRLARNRDLGILADGAGTTLTMADVVLTDTRGQVSDGMGGRGLLVQVGASGDVSRALLTRNRDLAVLVTEPGTAFTMADAVIRDTEAQATGALGRGLSVQTGASGRIDRASVSGNREVGVVAIGADTELVITDVAVEDTRSQEADALFGRGIAVQGGAGMELTRAVLSRNLDVGLFASGAETSLTARM